MEKLQVSPCLFRTRKECKTKTGKLKPSSDSAEHVRKLLSFLGLTLLLLDPGQCTPVVGRCVEQETAPLCIPNLQDYYAQTTNPPNRLNERSLAAWTYAENIDLNRVPQVIYEAVCLTSHSCRGVDGASRVESVPLAIRMPVLRVNPACQLRAIEFESINIACICATARQN
ncbi:hypothetical protein P4O66_012229 [Electrophorus voltai]|uniref:Uncharacterized protein n=1 Tax=Electrophorus voltai TaxID=2609070 RepID=A0AAD8Z380_9TELE|nr:hypothetical protein P4O66_012229 [Electrophorus voltai]